MENVKGTLEAVSGIRPDKYGKPMQGVKIGDTWYNIDLTGQEANALKRGETVELEVESKILKSGKPYHLIKKVVSRDNQGQAPPKPVEPATMEDVASAYHTALGLAEQEYKERFSVTKLTEQDRTNITTMAMHYNVQFQKKDNIGRVGRR